MRIVLNEGYWGSQALSDIRKPERKIESVALLTRSRGDVKHILWSGCKKNQYIVWGLEGVILAVLHWKEKGQDLRPQGLLVADYDAMLNRFPLRFSCRLVGAPGTSPELPVAFDSMIHARFIVRTMEVYVAPLVNRIWSCFHSNLTSCWSFSLRSA